MKKILLYITVVFLVGCSTLKVDVDYDTSYDFKNNTKYTIVHKHRVGENTLTNDRIISALNNELQAKSYAKVTKDQANLVFVFHVNVRDKTDIRTDYQMVGYGGYGFGRGFGRGVVETTSAYNYTEGTLIVDALNPKTNKIVWRGIAVDELSNSLTTPDKRTKYINEIIKKLMSNFPRKAK